MRPRITCHMVMSLDGRLLPERWSDPAGAGVFELIDRHYDAVAERLGAGGWLAGRRTMAAYVGEGAPPEPLAEPRPRPAHVPPRPAGREIGVGLDPSARLRWTGPEVEGDQAVAMLSERAPDAYLAELRAAGVGYVFAGPDGRGLEAGLAALGEGFGVDHLLLEGGGRAAGAFLAAGLIDAFSTLICPSLDGLAGIPAIFEHQGPPGARPAEGLRLRLSGCETLEGGMVWLRHEAAA